MARPLKKSITDFVDSVIFSMNSSSTVPHMAPFLLCIIPLPILPSAQPMPMFLLEPPKPPTVWPLKWVRASRD